MPSHLFVIPNGPTFICSFWCRAYFHFLQSVTGNETLLVRTRTGLRPGFPLVLELQRELNLTRIAGLAYLPKRRIGGVPVRSNELCMVE